MKAKSVTSVFVFGLILISVPGVQVQAQESAHIVPDAKAQGMGRAFTAIAEGPSTAWWNPGSLGIPQPLSASPISLSQLVPDLLDDVWLYAFGGAAHFDERHVGVGAHLSYITYGESIITNEQGDSLGTISSWEYMTLLGGAVDLGPYVLNTDHIHWGWVPM